MVPTGKLEEGLLAGARRDAGVENERAKTALKLLIGFEADAALSLLEERLGTAPRAAARAMEELLPETAKAAPARASRAREAAATVMVAILIGFEGFQELYEAMENQHFENGVLS